VRDPIEELVRVGAPDGLSCDEAVARFARLRSTPDEGRAIRRLLAKDAIAPLPEPLLLAVASALVDRGEEAMASAALARASSLPGLILRADLLERRGDLAGAMALVERVLLRDIDWVGARERHARWRDAQGRGPPRSERGPIAASAATWLSSPFQVLREVARGGAGVVYEAEDRDLGRRLALKVYHRPDRDRAQLLHEARVAVALAGEGVVRVFDADPDRGWIALEWAPLGALRGHLLRADASAIGGVFPWAAPLARALARVHAAGWVHQDVKPDNILLRAPGAPLLSDFGSARRRGAPSSPGSLGYVSPERVAGRPSDPRDDVYAFGRVLEDALDAGAEGDAHVETGWREVASACSGPDDLRPRDGAELVLLLDRMRPSHARK
jgi:eukaryotic-like serine/threonine-protein kinase